MLLIRTCSEQLVGADDTHTAVSGDCQFVLCTTFQVTEFTACFCGTAGVLLTVQINCSDIV